MPRRSIEISADDAARLDELGLHGITLDDLVRRAVRAAHGRQRRQTLRLTLRQMLRQERQSSPAAIVRTPEQIDALLASLHESTDRQYVYFNLAILGPPPTDASKRPEDGPDASAANTLGEHVRRKQREAAAWWASRPEPRLRDDRDAAP